MNVKANRNHALDTARCLAALAVVVLHSAAMVLNDGAAHGTPDWMWANLYDVATRWCVPVFVMISGVLLLDPYKKQETWGQFYGRRAQRIVPAIIFWSLFYLAWASWLYALQGIQLGAAAWWRKATSGEPYYHLWYLYMLLGLYLLGPVVQRMYRYCSAKQRVVVMVLLFAAAMLQALVRELNASSYGFFLFWCLPYLSYFWAGRVLVDGHVQIPAPLWVLLWAIVLTVIGTYWLSSTEQLVVYFYDNFSLTVPLMSLAVFQLILYKGVRSRFSKLVPYTFGIYLVHPAFLDLATVSGLYRLDHGIVWQVPFISALVVLASLAAVWLLRQSRYGRAIS